MFLVKAMHPIAALRTLPPGKRLAALEAALRHCDASERRTLLVEAAELAIEPAKGGKDDLATRALGLCLELWPELDGASRSVLRGLGVERLHDAASRLSRSEDARARLAGVSFSADALDAGDGAGASTLAGALGDALTSLADLAERALMRAVLRGRDEASGSAGEDESAREARRRARREAALAVGEGVKAYDQHKRRGILMGGLLVLGSPGSGDDARERLLALLREGGSTAGAALRAALRASGSALMREVAWRAMVHDEIGAAALDRVSRATSREEHESLLREMHLALHPKRRARAAMLSARAGPGRPAPGGAGALPGPEQVATLTPEARLGVLRALDVVEADEPTRRVFRAPFLTDASPMLRVIAASSAAPDELLDFAFDAHPVVARRATWQWSVAGAGWQRGGGEGLPLRGLRALTRSSHDVVRHAAGEELDRLDVLAGGARPSLALVALARTEPGRAREVLAGLLHSTDESARRRAAAWAARLPREAFPLEAMLEAARSDDPRLAAGALTALGQSSAPEARAALLEGLAHPDARARANAVEALARARRATPGSAVGALGGAHGGAGHAQDAARLWELRSDLGARTRANVLRAWSEIDPAQAGAELMQMLHDARPDHRRSGTWCAGRVMIPGALGTRLHATLLELGRHDPSDAVRALARREAARARGASGSAGARGARAATPQAEVRP